MLCAHSPEPKDVVVLPTRAMTRVEIKPKGKYLQQVIDAYTETYGGRPCSSTPKVRRYVGVARPQRDESNPHTEAALLRRRELEIRDIERAMEGPAPKKVRFDGVKVPDRCDTFDKTTANDQVRENAAKRKSSKTAGVSQKAIARTKKD